MYITTSDEPELEFSGSSRARKIPSQAKLGHFNFRAETELNQNFITHFFPKFLLSDFACINDHKNFVIIS